MARQPQRSATYEKIWTVVSKIPRGKVATYGQVAKLAGLPMQARLVGYALHSIPPGMPVPWHRVINARGTISFPEGSAPFTEQQKLLAREGVRVRGLADLGRFGWRPGQRHIGRLR